jgi:hypothetical protein
MRAGQAQVPESRSVGAELIGGEQFRREALFLEDRTKRPLLARHAGLRRQRLGIRLRIEVFRAALERYAASATFSSGSAEAEFTPVGAIIKCRAKCRSNSAAAASSSNSAWTRTVPVARSWCGNLSEYNRYGRAIGAYHRGSRQIRSWRSADLRSAWRPPNSHHNGREPALPSPSSRKRVSQPAAPLRKPWPPISVRYRTSWTCAESIR